MQPVKWWMATLVLLMLVVALLVASLAIHHSRSPCERINQEPHSSCDGTATAGA